MDHAHTTIEILPKCPVLQAIGYVKGKSATHLSRVYRECKPTRVGQHFWEHGLWLSAVRRNEALTTKYIRKQKARRQMLTPAQLLAMRCHGKVDQTS